MILLIDNYDSFVHNLARHIRLLGQETHIVRNDCLTCDDVLDWKPSAILLSPGPCTPAESGMCPEIVRTFGPQIPILGVCLGHQCIGEVYGGKTVRADRPRHGRSSAVNHDGEGLFQGLPNPFEGGRYHSLVVEIPEDSPLRITARTSDGIVMAVQHRENPVFGVQFHPESILTEGGLTLLKNFLTFQAEPSQ